MLKVDVSLNGRSKVFRAFQIYKETNIYWSATKILGVIFGFSDDSLSNLFCWSVNFIKIYPMKTYGSLNKIDRPLKEINFLFQWEAKFICSIVKCFQTIQIHFDRILVWRRSFNGQMWPVHFLPTRLFWICVLNINELKITSRVKTGSRWVENDPFKLDSVSDNLDINTVDYLRFIIFVIFDVNASIRWKSFNDNQKITLKDSFHNNLYHEIK